MKRNVTLFPKGNYASPTGNPTYYYHDEALFDVLGQAMDIRFHIIVHKLSATARATPWSRPVRTSRPSQAPCSVASRSPCRSTTPPGRPPRTWTSRSTRR